MEIDLSIIVATTQNGVIGNEGKLLWRLPSDLARFKTITKDTGIIIMGRKTYDSILARNSQPLSGRKHIVLSKRVISSFYESVQFVTSVEHACTEIAANGGRACVIGGGEIYKLFLPMVKKMYITTVHAPNISGDVYFPINPEGNEEWKCTSSVFSRKWHSDDEYETSFNVYERSVVTQKTNGVF